MVASADRATLCRSRTRGGWAPGVVRGPNHRRVVDAKTLTAWGEGGGAYSGSPSPPVRSVSSPPPSPRFFIYVGATCSTALSFLSSRLPPGPLAPPPP